MEQHWLLHPSHRHPEVAVLVVDLAVVDLVAGSLPSRVRRYRSIDYRQVWESSIRLRRLVDSRQSKWQPMQVKPAYPSRHHHRWHQPVRPVRPVRHPRRARCLLCHPIRQRLEPVEHPILFQSRRKRERPIRRQTDSLLERLVRQLLRLEGFPRKRRLPVENLSNLVHPSRSHRLERLDYPNCPVRWQPVPLELPASDPNQRLELVPEPVLEVCPRSPVRHRRPVVPMHRRLLRVVLVVERHPMCRPMNLVRLEPQSRSRNQSWFPLREPRRRAECPNSAVPAIR